jgi:hypothetical protein
MEDRLLSTLAARTQVSYHSAVELVRAEGIRHVSKMGKIYIYSSEMKRIAVLLKEFSSWQRREARRLKGVLTPERIYFVQVGDFVKIGRSIDVLARFATIQTSTPEHAALLGSIPGGPSVESEMHHRFSPHHYRGEWYRNEGTLAAFVSNELGILSSRNSPELEEVREAMEAAQVKNSQIHSSS